MTDRNIVRRGIRHQTSEPPRYFFPRPPTITDKKDPLTNKYYEVSSFAIIGSNPINGIPVKSGVKGSLYYLSKFDTNGDAIWLLVSTGAGISNVNDLRDQMDVQVGPSLTGNIDIDGVTVGNGLNPSLIPLDTVADTLNNTLKVQIQLADDLTGAPVNENDAGICSFDDTQFVVNDQGYCTLKGGGGLPPTQTLTGDAGSAVGPDGTGDIDLIGKTVAIAGATKPVFVRGTPGSNLQEIEVQVSRDRTAAPTDKLDAGLCSFDDTDFAVTIDGFVTFIGGGGSGVNGIVPEFATGGGTDPVVGDGSDNITHLGVVVLNGANANFPVTTHSKAAFNYKTEVQITKAVTPTPADTNDVGLASFNEDQFVVDMNFGMVSLKGGGGPPCINPPVGFENLGLVYTVGTGVLKITSGDGTALSATNIAYVTLNTNANPGIVIRVPITADQNFIDDNGASEIIDNLFGKTAADNWAGNDIPFYIYAVLSDDDASIAFMISRNPSIDLSPVVGKIGAPDDAVADLQSSFFSFDNIDETLYDTNSCLLIGSFRMRTGALDDWTVQALSESDGMGYFQEGKTFTMPQAIFGSATDTFLLANGGTAPVFTTKNYEYSIEKNGRVHLNIFLSGDGGADGASAVTAQVAIPYIASFVSSIGSLMVESPTSKLLCGSLTVSAQNYMNIEQGTDGTIVQNVLFLSGDRQISGSLDYLMLNDST